MEIVDIAPMGIAIGTMGMHMATAPLGIVTTGAHTDIFTVVIAGIAPGRSGVAGTITGDTDSMTDP